jgi:beta-lactamase regulating signal transducer with metallopeptidase domain
VDMLLRIGLTNAVLATLLALAVAGVTRWCRRPALIHALWLLVLLKLVTPPLFIIPMAWTADDAPGPAAAQVPISRTEALEARPDALLSTEPVDLERAQLPPLEETPPGALLERDVEFPPLVEEARPTPASIARFSWKPTVAALWLAGSLGWWLIAGVRVCRFLAYLRHAHPAPEALQERVRRLAGRLGVKRVPLVRMVAGRATPMLWALGRSPSLIMPAALWERLSESQRDTLLVHELAHLRRGDHWMRRFELMVLGLYWWHPVAWWARNRMQEAEEECCDGWVLWALPAAAEDYAAALVDTVAFLSLPHSAAPLGASGVGQVQSLRRRLVMVLNGTTHRPVSRSVLWVVLCSSAMILPWFPIAAQTPPPPAASPAEQVEPAQPPQPPPPAAATPTVPRAHAIPPQPESPPQPASGVYYSFRDALEARDTVELLKIQREAKEAELQEAKALLEKAARHLDRVNRLQGDHVIGEEEVQQARTDMTVQQARVRGKEAQVREIDFRLHQAARRVPSAIIRPSPAEEVAPRRPRTPPPATPPAGPEAADDVSRRLNDVESKVNALIREMKDLQKLMRSRKRGPGGLAPPASDAPPAPVDQPPPADDVEGTVMVEGTVTETDAKSDLVTVSIGSESGVTRGNTLLVYRLKPRPEYVGTLSVIDSQPKEAVARLIKPLRAGPVKKGDIVTSRVPATGG